MLTCKSFVILGERGRKTNRTISQLFFPAVSLWITGAEQLHEAKRMIRGIGNVLFSSYPTHCFSMLPTCRSTTRMTGIESPGWRLFTDGGFKRQDDGPEIAGWGIATVSPDHFVRILCGPASCDPRHPAFLSATSYSNNTAELTGFAEAFRWIDLSFLVVNECGSSMIPNTRLVLPLVLLIPKGTLPRPTNVTSLCCGRKALFTSRFTTFFSHAGKVC